MSQLFATGTCLSGECICRKYMQACLIADTVTNKDNHIEEKRRAAELLVEGRKLFTEQQTHKQITKI